MSDDQTSSKLEDRALLGFLAFLFLLGVVLALVETTTDVKISPEWNAPVIIAALYAILRLVGAVPEIRSNVKYLRDVANVRVQRMPNVTEYYQSLDDAVSKAASSLDLTHIRDTPPSDFGEQAHTFYSRLVEWCQVEGHSVRRVICVRTPAMLQWAEQLAAETAHLTRFKVRVITWKVNAPAINMAIVDNKAVYLALTGSMPERTKGLGIEDEEATQYFTTYYDNLWAAGQDLQTWLAEDSAEGIQ